MSHAEIDLHEAKERSLPARLAALVRDLDRARRRHAAGWGFMLARARALVGGRGFRPRHALALGLFDPALPEASLRATVPKARLLRLQARANPPFLQALTEDKSVFYPYCSASGIRVPRLLGVSARPVGRSADGRALASGEDWEAFAASLPDDFVVKPSRGAYGLGVRMFRRQGDAWCDSTGSRHASGALAAATRTHPRYQEFVIQERLRSHGALERLSDTEYLQTARIVTWVRDDGGVDIPIALFRIITGDSVVDNFASGCTGNVHCLVDPLDGTLEDAVGLRRDGLGVQRHAIHPRTGAGFAGFSLPCWDAACALARRAALLFLPLRTIGWDVALTPDGPCLVEGNMWWDPFNTLVGTTTRPRLAQGMIRVLELLEGLPGQRRAASPAAP